MSKAPLQLLTIILLFSFLLSSAAVPTTRSLLNWKNTLDDQLHGGPELRNEEEELMAEKRIDFENNDYPGTGANNRHVPKTPGRA
ncbi:uncharacterized protein [Cicer arietinum]|uniref:Uncharacterized protein 275 n=2 Tax=Cicer arietinum TaxID=3827 RepID=A0A1S2XR63_CICAR|nr:uncharacterized protein 275 [Cicer arietinum]